MSSRAELEDQVTAHLQTSFFETCIACSVIGIQIFMCIYGLTAFLETPKSLRQGRWIYVFISFIILGLYCFAELPFAYYTYVMLDKPCTALDTIRLANKLSGMWWALADTWASVVLFWLGDGLMVYRCYVVWANKRYVAILPGVVYLAAVATSTWFTVASQRPSTDKSSRIAYTVFSILSALVSCIVTCLIAGRLLHMRRKQTKILAGAAVDSKMYFGVISILVESAVPLAIAGIMSAVTLWAKMDKYESANNIFIVLWSSLTALSPQIIILRVTLGRSWAHGSHTLRESHLSTLAFQARTLHDSDSLGNEFEHSMHRHSSELQIRTPLGELHEAEKPLERATASENIRKRGGNFDPAA